MLATLFVFALWLDVDPLFERASTVAFLLAGYVLFALALVATTWSDWWLDARLAGPAHAVDIIVFTALIAFTEGYDSPYFTFFTFLLLAAAIRWGWRATTLTAILLMSLYLTAGLVVSGSGDRSTVHDFVDRTGHLVILSFVLIWFGINRWRAGMHPLDTSAFAEPVLDESPVATGLRAAMHAADAASGVLVWREHGKNHADVLVARAADLTLAQMSGEAIGAITTPFLYDLEKDRALTRDEERNLRGLSARDLIHAKPAKEFRLRKGLAVPIKTGSGEGELFLEDVPNLSVDHIDIGASIASDIVGLVERHALIIAIEESAEARSRLTLARDLHDSVVQFLAGTAFRLEALKRDLSAGRDVQPDLNHLKQLMLQEQGELRSFIAALRSAPQIELEALVQDLRSLASRLAQQWDVFCDFSAETTDMMVPTRLQLDTQHLVREAVANAVRHAGAKSVTIKLRAEAEKLRLDFINDGTRYPNSPLTGELPRSLSERVKLAGGVLELSRGMGVTRISVSLPIGRVN
jgi:signal transduction histidine kinase